MRVSVGKLDVLNSAADLFHWKGALSLIHISAQLLEQYDIARE